MVAILIPRVLNTGQFEIAGLVNFKGLLLIVYISP